MGPSGPPGPSGPAGAAAGGPPAGTASARAAVSERLGGLLEFRASGMWTAPAGVTSVLIEAWGAGGGGGGGSNAGAAGGGGGSGAYGRRVLAVVPGSTYRVVLGQGGEAGAPGTAGGPGSDTELQAVAGPVLLVARGGRGGAGAAGESPGAPGAGGRGETGPGITRDGIEGSPGTPCRLAPNPPTCLLQGRGGTGAATLRGSVDPPAAAGAGGAGGDGGRPGGRGQPGYAILQW